MQFARHDNKHDLTMPCYGRVQVWRRFLPVVGVLQRIDSSPSSRHTKHCSLENRGDGPCGPPLYLYSKTMDIIFADRVIPLASLCVRTRVRRNNMTTSVWMIERYVWHVTSIISFIHYPRLPSHPLTRRPKTPNWTHLHQIPNQRWYHRHHHRWMPRHRGKF